MKVSQIWRDFDGWWGFLVVFSGDFMGVDPRWEVVYKPISHMIGVGCSMVIYPLIHGTAAPSRGAMWKWATNSWDKIRVLLVLFGGENGYISSNCRQSSWLNPLRVDINEWRTPYIGGDILHNHLRSCRLILLPPKWRKNNTALLGPRLTQVYWMNLNTVLVNILKPASETVKLPFNPMCTYYLIKPRLTRISWG